MIDVDDLLVLAEHALRSARTIDLAMPGGLEEVQSIHRAAAAAVECVREDTYDRIVAKEMAKVIPFLDGHER